jgi:hypothetical protein
MPLYQICTKISNDWKIFKGCQKFVAEHYTGAEVTTGETGIPENRRVLHQLTVFFGTATAVIGFLGLVGLVFNVTVLWSFYPGYKTMAFSTAVLCLFFGAMLAYSTANVFRGKIRFAALLSILVIAVIEAIEIISSFQGGHSLIELTFVRIGDTIAGQPTTAISPGTSFFLILWITGFFILLWITGTSGIREHYRNGVSIIGLALGMASFTFLLSYAFNEPFLYGSRMIPVAAPTTLAVTFLGAGLVTAAGPESFPARYFIGVNPAARLLRTFLPLTVIIVLVESIFFHETAFFAGTSETILISLSIVILSLLTGIIVYGVSRALGKALESEESKRQAA